MSRCARPHVPEEEFHAWLDGALSRAQSAEIAEHLLGCLICRAGHADAVATRDRASAILAMAVPGGQRRAITAVQAPSRRRVGAAVAAALLVTGGWLANQPATLVLPTPRLSTMAFVAPALHAQMRDAAALVSDGIPVTRVRLLAARAALRPSIVEPDRFAASARSGLLAPATDVDPAMGWESISWEEALAVAGGSLARLDGLPVSAVQLQRNGPGIRPTFFVKQRLADGLAVWVIEGPAELVQPVHAAIEASGLASSISLRTRPDYVGSDDAPLRTLRLVTVAAAVSKDSVDALSARLRLE